MGSWESYFSTRQLGYQHSCNMNLTLTLHRQSTFWFIALIPLALIAFWITFFARGGSGYYWLDHFHGLMMAGWIAMLIAQGWLIRTNHRALHRQLGQLSYYLMPLLVISTLWVANQRLQISGVSELRAYVFGLQFILLLQLIVIYTFAIVYRKQADIHARLMICTALTLFDPIVARILANYLSGFLPYLNGHLVNAQATTAAMIVLLAGWLSWLDWHHHQRRDVFLPVTVLLSATWILILGIGIWPSWNAAAIIFTEAFASMAFPY